MFRTTRSTDQNNGAPYAGGATYTLDLHENLGDTVTRIHFLNRTTGSIQVNAWIVDSDRKELLGTINLAEHGNMISKEFALRKLEFVDSGSGAFSVLVKQGGA